MEKGKQRIEKIIKNRTFWFLIFTIVLIGLYYSNLLPNLKNLEKATNGEFSHISLLKIGYFIISIIGSIILIGITLLIKKKKEIPIHKLFIVIAILLGMGYLLLAPMYTGSDEFNHFYRIYEIAEGRMITPIVEGNVGGDLPSSLKEAKVEKPEEIKYYHLPQMIQIKLNPEERIIYSGEYVNTALYPPIQYLPQLIGVELGRLLQLNPYWIGMLGRVTNLAFYIILCAFAIKIVPKNKLFVMLLLLTPTVLSTAATLSADVFTNSLIALFIAYILKFIYTKERIKKKEYVLFTILILCVSICKIVYLPFVFLSLFIPKECFSSKKQKILYHIITIGIGMILSMVWLSVTNSYFAIYYTNSAAQKQFIFSHLVSYFFIVLRTYAEQFVSLFMNMMAGTDIYQAQLSIYPIISISFLAMLLLAIRDNISNKVPKVMKWVSGLICLAVMGLSATAVYIQVTAQFIALENPVAVGLQGRYFIPLLLLSIVFFNQKERKNEKRDRDQLIKWFVMLHLPVYLTILTRFLA